MDKIKNCRMICGEITVFLSMILLLILALVGTTLECARVNVGRSYADRGLQNAMDSLFTEYCIKLWEDYHLFFLEGEEGESADKDYITSEIYYYLKDTFDREREIVAEMDLLDMEVGQIEVTDIVRADDYKGELFLHEVLEYSKYQISEEFLTEGQKTVKSLEEVNACIRVVEKQMEAEEKMAEVSREILDFISVVEGISVGKTGIQYKRNGNLKTETYFIKKFCPTSITKANLAIDHDVVWNSLKGSYVNPVSMLEQLEAAAIGILCQLKLVEAQIEAGKPITPIDYMSFYYMRSNLIKETNGVLKKISKAEILLSQIREKQTVFTEETIELENVFNKEKEKLSETTKEAFSTELERLKAFAGLESKEESSLIFRVLNMEDALKTNKELVKDLLRVGSMSVGGNSSQVAAYIESVQQVKNKMKHYCVKEMQFDYSSFIIEKEITNPLESFSKGYKNNLLSLVIENPSLLSNKAKKSQSESFITDNSEEKQQPMNYMEYLKETAEDSSAEKISENIGEFNTLYNVEHWIESTVDEQFQKLLLTCYIEEHFTSYRYIKEGVTEKGIIEKSFSEENGVKEGQDKSDVKKQMVEKESVLAYEEEYIIAGNLKDKENLSDVVTKIVFIRSVLNYIYLLTDSEKSQQAYYTAAGLVGYSCMEPLVQLTKNIILIVWAAEEAMVDVAALLQEKEVPIFKTKETFCISYNDLLSFNRELIHKKAKEVPQNVAETAMNYQHYLQLLSQFLPKEKKLNRMMELIQNNIRLRYDEDFQFKNCIYGMEVKVDFYMKEKFIALPFVKNMLDSNGEGCFINSYQSYCY